MSTADLSNWEIKHSATSGVTSTSSTTSTTASRETSETTVPLSGEAAPAGDSVEISSTQADSSSSARPRSHLEAEDFAKARTVDLGDWSTSNRYTGPALMELQNKVNSMDTPEQLLEYYLKTNAPEKEGGGKYDKVSDYKPELMEQFLYKNPSIFKDNKIADNARLNKLDFPNTEQLKSYLKEAEETPGTPDASSTYNEAISIGQEIRGLASQYDEGIVAEQKMHEVIMNRVNENNVVEVWNNYPGGGDSSIIDTFTSEWLSEGEDGSRQLALDATMHIINLLVSRATRAGLTMENSNGLQEINQAVAKLQANGNDWVNGNGHLYGSGFITDDELKSVAEGPINTLVQDIINAENSTEEVIEEDIPED